MGKVSEIHRVIASPVLQGRRLKHLYVHASFKNMIKISKEKIKEIAEELDCGMKCYYNNKTKEIKTIIDFDSHYGADEELWEDVIKELEENRTDYVEIERMSSRESFLVMVDFTDLVDNSALREKLINSLNRSKPFRNFKWIIDNSGDYRQKWFEFKNQKYIEWVEKKISELNSMEESGNE